MISTDFKKIKKTEFLIRIIYSILSILIVYFCISNNWKFMKGTLTHSNLNHTEIISIILIITNLINVERLTSLDLMCGVLNQRCLFRYISILSFRKKVSDYTAIFINLKDFQYFNKKYGMNTGNVIMSLYAQNLKKFTKRHEKVCRLGGDFFIVLVKQPRAEALINYLCDMKVEFQYESKSVVESVYSRAGIYPIKEGDNIPIIMEAITNSLKYSRDKHVDFVWFSEEMQAQMYYENEIVLDFPNALKNDEFQIYYQPKFDMDKNQICGAEALSRWNRRGKLLYPDEYIPVLENKYLVIDLDFYVFDKVCSHIKGWLQQGYEVERTSINFSKYHLKNENFAERVISIVEKYQIDPKYIEVELTESAGYANFNAMKSFVIKMNEHGIAVSIDDFGTGHSTLSLLKELPVTCVKLDKSFLKDIEGSDKTKYIFIKNLIHMIKDLDMEVISEGVETEVQKSMLLDADCKLAQGFLYSRPLMMDRYEQTFLKHLN